MLTRKHPSVLIFLAVPTVFTLAVTLMSEAYGSAMMPTLTVKTLGKTLCLALGGYMIGMWLMYARTGEIVTATLANSPIPPTPEELRQGIPGQIFGVVGFADLPLRWSFAGSLPVQLPLVLAVPGLLAFLFGWLSFRSRVNGVYLSVLTQAMTLALSLWLFQNDNGFRGNLVSLGLGAHAGRGLPAGRMADRGQVRQRHPRDPRRRNAGAISRLSGRGLQADRLHHQRHDLRGGGALYHPQAGIINPAELAPIASVHLAVWVAIGGRGRL